MKKDISILSIFGLEEDKEQKPNLKPKIQPLKQNSVKINTKNEIKVDSLFSHRQTQINVFNNQINNLDNQYNKLKQNVDESLESLDKQDSIIKICDTEIHRLNLVLLEAKTMVTILKKEVEAILESEEKEEEQVIKITKDHATTLETIEALVLESNS